MDTNSKYIKDKLIGKGREARVYRCRDKEGKKYVMKIAPKSDRIAREGLKNEIKILTYIKHPNIIQLIDHYEDEENVYEIVEDMDTDLFDVLDNIEQKHTRMKLKDIKYYTKQILEAISFCHSQGLMHRDIKLENTCVSDGGKKVKIIDFGVGTYAPFARETCGTTDYVAPEIDGGKYYGNAIDIWALGVCVYQMLTLEVPFDTDRRHFKLHLPSYMDKDAKDFLTLIFNMNWKERPRAERLLKHPFLL